MAVFTMSAYTTLICSIVAALGSFVYGMDTGIVATTIAHDSFKVYMFGSTTSVDTSTLGAAVSVYYGGKAVGAFGGGIFLSKIGRKRTLTLSSLFAVVGAAIQTGSVHIAMLIVGRLVAGLATGALVAGIPVYIAEISVPERRAFYVGMQGMMLAIGFMVANWVGYAGSFAAYGDIQWRLPLAMQIPMALVLMVLSFFLPDSPRWLIEQDRLEDAKHSLWKFHGLRGEEYIQREFSEIFAQISFERDQKRRGALVELVSRKYLRRTATAMFILAFCQFSGSGAIQNYQSIMYASLGFKGRTVLLISGCYGVLGPLGQALNFWVVADKWPRTRTLYVGIASLTVCLVVLTPISAVYGDGSNESASSAGVAFIFLYSFLNALFLNSTPYIVASELFPYHLRGYGSSIAIFTQACAQILITQVTPLAFKAIEWKYYFVFIASNVVAFLFYMFLLPDTNGHTLESIGALFGDEVKAAPQPPKDIDVVVELEENVTPAADRRSGSA
ncbi:hypothetical protein A1O3_06156 [Capronia epimyces CBS 606.96]|uniref:Major facilitator superfamily (MFS) profile domain-containing protein n=1 Tax=Capronia epimyces CBS 606.96 TaxID=1182542 RepID=W9XQ79_9EURO|nr:uncharacterized protein A1O3_06156 [Capronia epimyces CBS 606.96]EXJ82343.1 hypothetical protein A1O3_06156 [Capronia epimyces CBS 606.96]